MIVSAKVNADVRRFGFQGAFAEYDEDESGLHHFELREYDSRLGRMLIPDPYGQFASPYIAMGNNPANFTDPDGGFTGGGDPLAQSLRAANEQLISRVTQSILREAGTTILDDVLVTAGRIGASSTATLSAIKQLPDIVNSYSEMSIYGNIDLLNGPDREPYTGLLGTVDYVLSGGIENGYRYNINGEAQGLAPMAGVAPDVGVGKIKGLLNAPKTLAKHHIFPQSMRAWFTKRGINNIDDYTILVEHWSTHLKGIHGKGLRTMPGRWNPRWKKFIEQNPNATPSEIFKFGEDLLQEYGLEFLKYVKYK